MQAATERLEKIIGNTYIFEDRSYTIYDVKINGNIATLKTGGEDIELPMDGLDDYLSEFKLKKSNELLKQPDIVDMVVRGGGMYDSLQATLLATILKVQEDASYIPQANAINDTVKTVVDLEKVKIQTISLLKG